MARQQIVKLYDDITGEDITDQRDAGPVEFEIEGKRYEVDLSAQNREALLQALKPFTSAGRRVATGGARRALESPARRPARTDPAQLAAIRRWGQENAETLGLKPPSDRGRIPAEVMEAYREHDGKKVHKQVGSPFVAA